jgi:hypothetical protein
MGSSSTSELPQPAASRHNESTAGSTVKGEKIEVTRSIVNLMGSFELWTVRDGERTAAALAASPSALSQPLA